MNIDKKDFEARLNPLPVRKGCGAYGPCACTGSCSEIIGFIDFEIYEVFKKNYVSEEDFLNANIVLRDEPEPEKKVEFYEILFDTKVDAVNNKYMTLNLMKQRFKDFSLSCIGKRITSADGPNFYFVDRHKYALKDFVEAHGGRFIQFPEFKKF